MGVHDQSSPNEALWDWRRERFGPLESLGVGPLLPERIPMHSEICRKGVFACAECWNTGVRVGDYLEQKRLQEMY